MRRSLYARPALVALLNALFCTGGLGYLLQRQWRKGLITMAIVIVLQGLDLGGSMLFPSMPGWLLFPLVYVFQVLTAVDAWIVARREARGEEVPKGFVAVPMIRWLGTPSTHTGSPSAS